MCGYIFLKSNIKKDHDSIKKSIPKIENRGPDQTNTLDIENFFAVHSRLIVQGTLDDGIQPMSFRI